MRSQMAVTMCVQVPSPCGHPASSPSSRKSTRPGGHTRLQLGVPPLSMALLSRLSTTTQRDKSVTSVERAWHRPSSHRTAWGCLAI